MNIYKYYFIMNKLNKLVLKKETLIPRAGVRSASTETWFVWFSAEWTDTLVDLKFLNTVSGDLM
jgi:hypothetical protein